MIRRFILLLFIAVPLLLSACAKEPAPLLRVGANIWLGYEPLFVASEMRFFDDDHIRLIQYPSSTEVMRAFQSGLLEVAALTLDEVLMLKDRGIDVQILLITDFSNGADAILGRPGITSLQGLRGKRVGVESTALGGFFLARALEKEGILLEEITIVPLELGDHEKAFQQGKVDGVVTFAPVSTNLLSAGAVLLYDSSRIPGEIVDVLVVRKSVVEKYAECLDSLYKGWFRAVEHTRQNPADVAAKAAPRENISPDAFLEALKGIHILNRQEYEAMKEKRALQDSMTLLNRMMVSKGLVRQMHDPPSFINISTLKKNR